MRYMALLKGSKESEAYVPSAEEMAAMGDYVEEAMKAGWLIDTAGLFPSAKASRIKLSGDKLTVIDGPFTESKEIIASYAMLQVNSKQEAVELTEQFLGRIGGGEIELWQVYDAPHQE